jgi:hypothetical protein
VLDFIELHARLSTSEGEPQRASLTDSRGRLLAAEQTLTPTKNHLKQGEQGCGEAATRLHPGRAAANVPSRHRL